jgi:anthranilate phosphoribosyltransferase
LYERSLPGRRGIDLSAPGIFGEVAAITLRGEPYQQVRESGGVAEQIDSDTTLRALAENTRYKALLPEKLAVVEPLLTELFERDGYYGIQQKIEQGAPLTFEEAFSLATFVCIGLNKPLGAAVGARLKNKMPEDTHLLQATALLAAMSTKEAYVGLTASEIAGMVAATVHLDTVVRTSCDTPVIAFGGMGGDKGYPLNGRTTKLFSLSTLAAIVLSADTPVHKHHSYPNTSKVAGQSAIEAFGARSDFQTTDSLENTLRSSGLLMTSCHTTRTLHTLSHKLKGETVNHVIGPLSFTMTSDTPLHAMIGVNEKVHPSVIVDALAILSRNGFQRYENSAVYCGTLTSNHRADTLEPILLKHIVVLDEVAPPPYDTIVSFLVGGENAGTYVLTPEDFYDTSELASFIPESLAIPNDRAAIIEANTGAICGDDMTRARYLAMTVGLGLFVRHCLNDPQSLDRQSHRVNREMLRTCTKKGLELIRSGKGKEQLAKYITATNAYAGKKGVL